MPEGHVTHRLARTLTADFGGRPVRVSSPQGRFADAAVLLDGTVLEGAEAVGKHLFVRFEGDRIVWIHLGLIGKLQIGPDEHVLDAAMNAGLDLPFSCKAGVCCTCRAKVLCGEVVMDKNYTLEGDEMAQGFVLSCQARATTKQLTVSFDER